MLVFLLWISDTEGVELDQISTYDLKYQEEEKTL